MGCGRVEGTGWWSCARLSGRIPENDRKCQISIEFENVTSEESHFRVGCSFLFLNFVLRKFALCLRLPVSLWFSTINDYLLTFSVCICLRLCVVCVLCVFQFNRKVPCPLAMCVSLPKV